MNNIIFNSVKEYPDMIKITIYRQPFAVNSGVKKGKPRKKQPDPADLPASSSIARTRIAISDLCICNQFDLFCTFTFDPRRIDSFNIRYCRMFMNHWCRNAKQRHSPNLKYLIVPELHESGRIHFHALLRGFNGELRDSKLSNHGRKVYNVKNWRFGYSTAVKIDNIVAVSRYIRKYITKDMILFPGAKRYFCSQNLIRPTKQTNMLVDWIDRVAPDKIQFNINENAEFYQIRKIDYPFDPRTASQPRLF